MAALERELWPLVKEWPRRQASFDGRWYEFFEQEGSAAVVGGIGPEAARRAAEAIIRRYRPMLVVSAGFAGGLDPALRVGDVLRPRSVLNAADGSRTDSGMGEGVLISFPYVADYEQKAKLRQAYPAQAVDMEASAVAQSAQAHGVTFMACKVVSDTLASALPPFELFVGNDGRFHTLRFVAYVALRPWLWPRVKRWAGETRMAAANLCAALVQVCAENLPELERLPR